MIQAQRRLNSTEPVCLFLSATLEGTKHKREREMEMTVKSEPCPTKRHVCALECGRVAAPKCVKRRRRDPSAVALSRSGQHAGEQNRTLVDQSAATNTNSTSTTTTTVKRSSRFRGVSRSGMRIWFLFFVFFVLAWLIVKFFEWKCWNWKQEFYVGIDGQGDTKLICGTKGLGIQHKGRKESKVYSVVLFSLSFFLFFFFSICYIYVCHFSLLIFMDSLSLIWALNWIHNRSVSEQFILVSILCTNH